MLETGQTAFMITHDVDEAIYLADKIFLMTNGPARCWPRSWKTGCRRTAAASICTVIRYYYAVRNHIVDFLVSRSKTFAAETPDHDPRNVPTVRLGLSEPIIVAAPKPGRSQFNSESHRALDLERRRDMKRADLTEKLLDIKREKGWSWKHICEKIGGYSEVLISAPSSAR